MILTGLAASLNANILPYLFGAILTVSSAEVAMMVGLGGAILATLVVAGRTLLAVVVDEDSARVAGLPVDALNGLLAILTAVTVVIGMRVVGILLVAALMVLSVGTSQAIAHSFRSALGSAAATGVVSVVTGLVASRGLGLASGGTVVIVASLIFVLASIASRPRAVSEYQRRAIQQ